VVKKDPVVSVSVSHKSSAYWCPNITIVGHRLSRSIETEIPVPAKVSWGYVWQMSEKYATFFEPLYLKRSRDSSVGKAKGYRFDYPGISCDSRQRQEASFSSVQCPDRLQSPIALGTRGAHPPSDEAVWMSNWPLTSI
jgi:hypothetical protein